MPISAQFYRSALLWCLALGAVLRFWGLDWDAGRGLHPDEGNLVRGALGLGAGGRWLPEFHAYNDLALWLPRVLALPFCDSADGSCLTLVARALSAGLSLAMIWPAATLARLMAGRAAGLAAALALVVSAPMVQWAHFGTTESAIALVVVLCWALAARWQAGEITDRQFAILGGAVLGVGFGFKTTALVVGLIPGIALLLPGAPIPARLRIALIMGAIAIGQALAFAPSVIFRTEAWLGIMDFENGVVRGTVPVFWTAQFHGAVNGLFEARQLWSLTQGAGLVLMGAGLALMPRPAWRLALPGVMFAAVYLMLIMGWHAKFVRYLAPAIPVIVILAGVGVGRLLTGVWGQAARAGAVAGLGLMVIGGLDGWTAYLRPDPRIVIESELMRLARPDQRVAVEPRDLAQTGLMQQAALPLMDGMASPEALADVLAGSDWLIIASRRNWAVLPRQHGAPAVICTYYAALAEGGLGFVRVARADRRGVLGHLFDPGLAGEETRNAFDRPEVLLFRNVDRLNPDDLRARLSALRDPAECSGPVLADRWRRGT